MIPGQAQQFFEAAAAQSGGSPYEIERSLRFNSGDTAYLNKTLSYTGNRRTWTLSFWVKRAIGSTTDGIFCAYDGSISEDNYAIVQFGSNDQFYVTYAYAAYVQTNRKFRDPSSWYHIVVVVDTNNSTAGDRVQVYVNGERETDFAASHDPDLGQELAFNKACPHYIGSEVGQFYSDCYYAEMHFIDGQALAPTDFGEFDSTNNWIAKEYTAGSYGSNGFYLKFNDNSSASALGTDSSGNSNTWTVNNLTAENPKTLPGVDFDGSNDYVESADDADYSLGTNDFTMECYIYPRTFDNYKALMMKHTGTRSTSSWFWSLNSSGHILFYLYYGSSEMGIVTSGTGMTLNKWNHVACVRDGSTARVYINGVQVGTGNISTNSVNDSSTAVRIGEDSQGFYDLDGIMSNVRLINGTCLYPSGTTFTVPSTPLTNVTNTKLLCCQSSSSATAATVSPNTLTTGGDPFATERSDSTSADDSLIDTPTDYVAGSGNNGGNYCTLIPLKNAQTLSNGNLDVVGGSSWQRSVGSLGMFSGKYYWEYEITASNEHLIGVGPVDMQLSGNLGAGSPPGSGYGTELGFVNGTGANGSWSNTGASGAGDIIGIAFDADNGNMYVYKNGSALNGGIASHTGLVMPQIPVVSLNGSSRSGVINFGQRPFKYTPPTDYVSLCTTNLADPAIADPSTAMDATAFTANNGSQSINLGFSPDLVWTKSRANSYEGQIFDTLRGNNQELSPNATRADRTLANSLTFDSSGFTMPSNNNNANYGTGASVAWTWDAGDTTTTVAKDANGTNLPGATCEYRANTTNGFSVVKVADPQSNEARVHGLGVAPDFFICKSTASADSWHTYWKVLGRSYYINLNGTGPATSSDQFGSQEPDSTYFYVKSNTGSGANKSGGMVYYLWSAVDQYSAFGEYVGNANADGPFVFTGFRPKWIVFKMRSGSGDWRLMDTSRDLINPCDSQLYPNNADAENSSSAHEVDYLSNGFKIVTSHSAMNSSGQSYLYAAFAEHPFKSARAR